MGGKNPYLPANEPELPVKPYKLVIKAPEGAKPGAPKVVVKTIEVDPGKIPYGETGLSGSLLDIALNHGVEIDHACGGVAACSTCHVYVKKGLATCNEPLDEELDQLDNAPALQSTSRLSCQCVPNGQEDVEIEIPAWNRNLVREGH